MMPENLLSTTPVPGEFLAPDGRGFTPLEDRELGGVAHQDPSQGLMLKEWRAWIDAAGNIYVQPVDGSQPALLITTGAVGSDYISLSFDRNMRVVVAWRRVNIVYLYWYDSLIEAYRTSELSGIRTPRLTHDDKRERAGNSSDVLFFYLKDTKLCMRMQRDRYGVEYELANVEFDHALYRVGMSNKNRLQIEVR